MSASVLSTLHELVQPTLVTAPEVVLLVLFLELKKLAQKIRIHCHSHTAKKQ
jgi:hypothetical protein